MSSENVVPLAVTAPETSATDLFGEPLAEPIQESPPPEGPTLPGPRWDELDEADRAAWLARADAAVASLAPLFKPWDVGLSYAAPYAGKLNLWCSGIVKDPDLLISLPDETEIPTDER